MKFLVINGVNLNMLGVREKELYGDKDYKSLIKCIKSEAKQRKIMVKCVQSNYEGDIVNKIQKAYNFIPVFALYCSRVSKYNSFSASFSNIFSKRFPCTTTW